MATLPISDAGAEIRPVELVQSDGATWARVNRTNGGGDAFGGFATALLATAYQLVYNGATWDRLRTPSRFVTVDLASGTAETTVWTPAAGKKFRLMGLFLKAGAATKLTFKDGTGGAIIVVLDLDAAPNTLYLGNGILSAAANNVLTVTRSVAATLAGMLIGCDE